MGRRVSALVWSGVILGAGIVLGASANPKVERGKYLVERASVCIDCHTPMTPKGEPDKTRWMMGADVFVKAIVPVPAWADQAPSLAGLVGYTDAQVIGILQNGLKDGKPLRPPMPPYRFTREDAEAIVAFLRTLKPPPNPAGRR
ncbi:MAG: cytochrome c [Bryobacteraceae bacterium]